MILTFLRFICMKMLNYYIERIEPMIDNLNRQQEIQIDNTKFFSVKNTY